MKESLKSLLFRIGFYIEMFVYRWVGLNFRLVVLVFYFLLIVIFLKGNSKLVRCKILIIWKFDKEI